MAKVTYHAPEGDDRYVEVFNIGFVSGRPVEMDVVPPKLFTNQHFTVEGAEPPAAPKPKGKPGRKPKVVEPEPDADEADEA